MNRGYSRSITIAAAIIMAVGLSQFANAQTSPEPQPMLTQPSGGRIPENRPFIIPENQVPPPAPAVKFQSPFNGEKDADSSGEAVDFGKLMDLYDTMKDAEANLEAAKKCKNGVTEAQKVVDRSTATFNTAMAHFANDWSANAYAMDGGTVQGSVERSRGYTEKNGDRDKILGELAKQDKKKHVTGACPATPKTPAPSETPKAATPSETPKTATPSETPKTAPPAEQPKTPTPSGSSKTSAVPKAASDDNCSRSGGAIGAMGYVNCEINKANANASGQK
jgi:hypothetical protein